MKNWEGWYRSWGRKANSGDRKGLKDRGKGCVMAVGGMDALCACQ